MNDSEQQAAIIAQSLQESVAEALEKKRRLGQTAVIWENGQVVYLHPPENTKHMIDLEEKNR